MNKSIREGGFAIRLMREKQDALNVLTWETTIKNLTQFEEVERLKQSLKRARNTLDGMEEKVSQLNDEIVATSFPHYEKTRRRGCFSLSLYEFKFDGSHEVEAKLQ